MSTPVFWLTATQTVEHHLRRYARSGTELSCVGGYHHAATYIGTDPAAWRAPNADWSRSSLEMLPLTPHDDPRWPTNCSLCDYAFTDDDEWQDFQDLVYADDEGHPYVLRSLSGDGYPVAPPGAMWDAWWMSYHRGDDDICLMVRLPDNSDWMVDSHASNCTMPDDDVHRCWCRHGDPRNPQATNLTVDKNCSTCNAGAGSIASKGYHGFLIDAALT